MLSKAEFQLKNNIRNWSNQEIAFATNKFKTVSINIKDVNCGIIVESNLEKDNLEYIIPIYIWRMKYYESNGYK